MDKPADHYYSARTVMNELPSRNSEAGGLTQAESDVVRGCDGEDGDGGGDDDAHRGGKEGGRGGGGWRGDEGDYEPITTGGNGIR